MRYLIVLVITFAVIGSELAIAQDSAQQRAATFREQLIMVEKKQAELQTRREKLEEDIKPENIAENLAGIGSTKPEDLREQRRRQLEIELNSVKTQLDLLANSKSRLEIAIARADAEAYRQSAAPTAVPSVTTTNADDTSAASTAASPTLVRPKRVRRKRVRRAKRVASIRVE